MDAALPQGGLQRIMQQYDSIRSHATRDDGPAPWEPEEDQGDLSDNSPPQGDLSDTPTPDPAPTPTEITGSLTPVDTPQRQDDGRVTVEVPRPPQQVMTDSTQERPRGRPKSWTEDDDTKKREAAGQRNMQFAIDHPNRGTFAADETGLNKAYGDTTTEGTYYDPSNRTMYIKGTVPTSASDWWDDLSKIPAWGDIHDAERTKQAEAAYDQFTKEGKVVDRVVGHSLGGSVALQLQKDKDIPFSRTFGAPVMELNPFQKNAERYRHPRDIFSIFDRSATNIMTDDINPHSFGGFSNNYSIFGKSLGA